MLQRWHCCHTLCQPSPGAAVPLLGFLARWVFGPGLSLALTLSVPPHSLRQFCASGQREQGLACSVAWKWVSIKVLSAAWRVMLKGNARAIHPAHTFPLAAGSPHLSPWAGLGLCILRAGELLHALSVHIFPRRRGQQCQNTQLLSPSTRIGLVNSYVTCFVFILTYHAP